MSYGTKHMRTYCVISHWEHGEHREHVGKQCITTLYEKLFNLGGWFIYQQSLGHWEEPKKANDCWIIMENWYEWIILNNSAAWTQGPVVCNQTKIV